MIKHLGKIYLPIFNAFFVQNLSPHYFKIIQNKILKIFQYIPLISRLWYDTWLFYLNKKDGKNNYMNNLQSILTIGSIFILSLVSLSFNSSLLQNNTVELENKVYLTAFSLADDVIEEIKQKAFDEKTLVFPTVNRSTLTPAGSLGNEGESYPYFDDVDDYNNYSRDADEPHAEKYHISAKVYYVSETDPDTKSSTQTFHKRVDVTVSSPYLNNNAKLTFIFTHK